MLIRCEYCGMAYDGGSNENCPHCLAPRPMAKDDDKRERKRTESRILTILRFKSGIFGTNDNDVFSPLPYFRCRVYVSNDGSLYCIAILFCRCSDMESRRAFEAALDEIGTWRGTPEYGYVIDDLRLGETCTTH